MLLHIPHSSTHLPTGFSVECDINDELFRMTDWFTDELFKHEYADVLIFPHSRLYCDVERFRDDALEPMSKKGMGVCYVNNSFGGKLRDISDNEIEYIKTHVYDKHHQQFNDMLSTQLSIFESVVIVDCHSFSHEPLPHEDSTARPDFCLGTDAFHTPPEMVVEVKAYLESNGFSVEINEPFGGTIVPTVHYGIQPNVRSIMIEVNRSLYMDGTGKSDNFGAIKSTINMVLDIISKYEDRG